MSIETWKAEFYFINAHDVAVEDVVSHSLTKWKGLRPENLLKHGLRASDYRLYDIYKPHEFFTIGVGSCSLCQKYMNRQGCSKCPLFKLLGTSCDDEWQPFDYFCLDKNPEPMIHALETLLKSQ